MIPLKGIKVLDFTTFAAGPAFPSFLSEFGADVIKVEPFDGDLFRLLGASFMVINRGKRSLSIDLKKEQSKLIMKRLIEKTDIIVMNTRPGIMEKLGLDYPSVKAINPRAIYLQSPPYGTKGPKTKLAAFDPIPLSLGGMYLMQRGPGNPMYYKIPFCDAGTPVLCFFGVALALLARARTGQGQLVGTSLLNTAIAYQATEFMQYKKIKRSYVKDMNAKGRNATDRLYLGLDAKWFYVSCKSDEHWKKLCDAIDLDTLKSDPRFKTREKRLQNDAELAEVLFPIFSLGNASDWVTQLQKIGVPCTMSVKEDELYDDPHGVATGMFHEFNDPMLGPAKAIGHTLKFSEFDLSFDRLAPFLGQHSSEILKEVGYTDEQIQQFIENKIIQQSQDKPLKELSDEALKQRGYPPDFIARIRTMQ